MQLVLTNEHQFLFSAFFSVHSMLISIFFCLNLSLCYLNKPFFSRKYFSSFIKILSAKINSDEQGCLKFATHISCIMLTVQFRLLYLLANCETLLYCAKRLQLLRSVQRQILKSQEKN